MQLKHTAQFLLTLTTSSSLLLNWWFLFFFLCWLAGKTSFYTAVDQFVHNWLCQIMKFTAERNSLGKRCGKKLRCVCLFWVIDDVLTIILCMLQGHHQNIALYFCFYVLLQLSWDMWRCFKPPIVICYCSITVLLSAVALYCSCRTTVVNVVKWVIIHTQPKVSSGFSGISRLPSCFFLLAYSCLCQ